MNAPVTSTTIMTSVIFVFLLFFGTYPFTLALCLFPLIWSACMWNILFPDTGGSKKQLASDQEFFFLKKEKSRALVALENFVKCLRKRVGCWGSTKDKKNGC